MLVSYNLCQFSGLRAIYNKNITSQISVVFLSYNFLFIEYIIAGKNDKHVAVLVI